MGPERIPLAGVQFNAAVKFECVQLDGAVNSNERDIARTNQSFGRIECRAESRISHRLLASHCVWLLFSGDAVGKARVEMRSTFHMLDESGDEAPRNSDVERLAAFHQDVTTRNVLYEPNLPHTGFGAALDGCKSPHWDRLYHRLPHLRHVPRQNYRGEVLKSVGAFINRHGDDCNRTLCCFRYA
jgi:hypothetical protein